MGAGYWHRCHAATRLADLPRSRSNQRVTPTHIQLVAADLDGTLLDSHKRLDSDTAAAIRRLPEMGLRFVIASARPPRSVRSIYNLLGLETWQINYNGALIWDEPAQLARLHRPLQGPLVLEIIRFARAFSQDVLLTCEILDKWHTDRFDNHYTTETGKLFKPDVIAPVETYCGGDVTKLLLLGEAGMIHDLEQRLARHYAHRVALLRTDANLIQIMAREVNKAMALRHIATHYGAMLERVLSIGDALNDAEMLEECGVGVAVANAPPRVRELADWVAPSNDQQGVLAALRRYISTDL
jgi:Cof subfamily protein (haloacid dehalogenase superfamily)